MVAVAAAAVVATMASNCSTLQIPPLRGWKRAREWEGASSGGREGGEEGRVSLYMYAHTLRAQAELCTSLVNIFKI